MLIFSSRGISFRDRHLMQDFKMMMPHAKGGITCDYFTLRDATLEEDVSKLNVIIFLDFWNLFFIFEMRNGIYYQIVALGYHTRDILH